MYLCVGKAFAIEISSSELRGCYFHQLKFLKSTPVGLTTSWLLAPGPRCWEIGLFMFIHCCVTIACDCCVIVILIFVLICSYSYCYHPDLIARTSRQDSELKLADFGLAIYVRPGHPWHYPKKCHPFFIDGKRPYEILGYWIKHPVIIIIDTP